MRKLVVIVALVGLGTSAWAGDEKRVYKWTDAEGVDRYGCEIIAETIDFLSRAKQTENEGDEPDNQDEIPF